METEGLNDAISMNALFVNAIRSSIHDAADEITHLLANYAKTHHGDRPRAAGWVYPGGGRQVKVKNMYFKGTGTIGPGSYFRRTRRWREGGTGWGDVTGNLNNATDSWIDEETNEYVIVALGAGMTYAFFIEKARKGRWMWLWPAIEANRDNITMILAAHSAGVDLH